jgi:hypothetical protein
MPTANRPGGLMGLTYPEQLEYLHSFDPKHFNYRHPMCHWSNDHKTFTIQGRGEAIVLTETGWFLEDTSGG